MRRAGAGLWPALPLTLADTRPAVAQADPPPNRITVDVSWPDDYLVRVSYEIGRPGLASDGPSSHGCSSLSGRPEHGDPAPNRLEMNILDRRRLPHHATTRLNGTPPSDATLQPFPNASRAIRPAK